jgi:PPOX class probable F420-dependent enzyme
MTVSDFPPELCELLDSPAVAIVSTTGARGEPQSSVTWIERRGAHVAFFAEPDTAKVRNLERNPEIVIVVVDPNRSHAPGVPAYVRLSGIARIEPGEPEFCDRLAKAYGNAEGYPWPKKPYVNVHVDVKRISGLGPFPTRKLGGWQPR